MIKTNTLKRYKQIWEQATKIEIKSVTKFGRKLEKLRTGGYEKFNCSDKKGTVKEQKKEIKTHTTDKNLKSCLTEIKTY